MRREPSVILDPNDRLAIQAYLVRRGLLEPLEVVREVLRPGPGNMNLVLRVVTDSASFILKQARPYVEKYPHVAAPVGRALVEARWYALASGVAGVARRLPLLLDVDPGANALVLGDLGPVADLAGVYADHHIGGECIDALATWLAVLHGAFRSDGEARGLTNGEMRRLNHEHIFEVPLRVVSGLDLDALTPGLGSVAERLRADRPLRAAITALGAAYLGEGSTLLHGDFHPGSWLAGVGGPYVVDPEFGFYGPPEFDVGVALAHLELAGAHVARDRMLAVYQGSAPVDVELAWAFSGVEVIRRLLGVAQLPLSVGLDDKRTLIERAALRVRAAA